MAQSVRREATVAPPVRSSPRSRGARRAARPGSEPAKTPARTPPPGTSDSTAKSTTKKQGAPAVRRGGTGKGGTRKTGTGKGAAARTRSRKPAPASGPAKRAAKSTAKPAAKAAAPKGAAKTAASAERVGDRSEASPVTRRALRSQGRRTMRKLLDAAMEVFDERGYHATRINDVVEVAETSHGTFYLYFSNKEDLLRALVAEAAEEGLALRNDPSTTAMLGSTRDDLRAWIGQYSTFWTNHAPLMRVWTELTTIEPGLGRLVRRTLGAMEEALASRISTTAEARGIDPRAASLAVLSMLDRFHFLREFLGEPMDEAALDALTDIVHRALFSPDPAAD